MAKLQWGATGAKKYETGIEKVALYIRNGNAYGGAGNVAAWQGVTSVNESASGGDINTIWADNMKYAQIPGKEEFSFTIEAYDKPSIFGKCDGENTLIKGLHIKQQERQRFALAYVTTVGNDEKGNSFAKMLHIVVGAHAKPSSKSYSTIQDSPEPISFSWDCDTLPEKIPGYIETCRWSKVFTDKAEYDAVCSEIFDDTCTFANLAEFVNKCNAANSVTQQDVD